MRTILSFLACFALIGATHAAADNVHTSIDWRVTIDARGHVTTMTALPHERVDKVPQIRARLEQEVHTWKFLPGLVDGKPAETQTGLYLRTTLVPAGNNIVHIRIDYASVGATETRMTPPHYPASAVRLWKTGQVVLVIAYDAEGKIVSAKPAPDSPKVDSLLIQASEEAARTWKFQPEVVGGHPLAGHALVPFCYRIRFPGSSQRVGKCDWKRPGSDETLRDGETLALNPAAKLLTAVAGRTL